MLPSCVGGTQVETGRAFWEERAGGGGAMWGEEGGSGSWGDETSQQLPEGWKLHGASTTQVPNKRSKLA